MQLYQHKFKLSLGFTLIELMIVVMIIAMLTAIAIPSYQMYARRANAAAAQQEMQKLAEQLERHRSRNFSYRGFNPQFLYNSTGNVPFNATTQTLTLPLNGTVVTYTLTIVDSMTGNPMLTDSTAIGQGWAIKAVSTDVKNFSLLMNSLGTKCKNVSSTIITYTACGAGGESW